MRKRHNLQIGLVAIMKPRNIIFIIASLIVFTALSVISFILAGGNYGAEFIFIFCLAPAQLSTHGRTAPPADPVLGQLLCFVNTVDL